MKKIYILFILSALSNLSYGQLISANNSLIRQRYEFYPQVTPATPDINRIAAVFISGMNNCTINTTDFYFTKFATSGNKVVIADSNGAFQSLPLSSFNYTAPDSTINFDNVNKTATVNQSLVMMADRASDSIAAINSRILLKANSSDVYTKSQSDGKYLQSFTESDPIWIAQKSDYSTKVIADGLYKAIGYVPAWTDITGKPSFFSGAYADLTGKPTLFDGEYNSLTNRPTIPTTTSQLTNNSGFLTGINSGQVTTALGYTPLQTEVDGSITNEIELASQAGQSGKVLSTNGTTTSWISLPSAVGTNNAAGYGSGTVYTLSTTSAKVDFGTTDPVITLPAAGTYLITSNVTVEYAGLTTLATAACNFKLRRTNNTAADLTNATSSFNVPAVALLTQTAGDADIQSVIYTTANNNDVIEVWGSRGNNVSLGSINVGQASVIAIRIY